MPRPCHPVPGRPVQAAVLQGSCAGERLLVVCFRSDNYAAVLRLQNTQPKDRRIYTAFTGILQDGSLYRTSRNRMARARHREAVDSNA